MARDIIGYSWVSNDVIDLSGVNSKPRHSRRGLCLVAKTYNFI